MKRPHTRNRFYNKSDASESEASRLDFIRFHLGTNSIFLALTLSICVFVAFKSEVLNWNYLKGLNTDLTFFIGLFSIILGIGSYSYWKLGEKSVYTFHFAKSKFLPRDANVIFAWKNFSFGVSSHIKTKSFELPSFMRAIFCIGIFVNLAIVTIDNEAFNKLIKFPSDVVQSNLDYCPEKEQDIENIPTKEGCELIVRAYKLGYAKDLGLCETKKSDPEKMQICKKRRRDEPYIHYMSRLLLDSIERKIDYFYGNRARKIKDKFDLQLQKLETLKDYQVYAISAAPRASHHVWTDLPYPGNIFIQMYREYFNPNYCIGQFQNQTNTVNLEENDERQYSKLMEHVYGQLLFNPKSEITVGYCKEYQIHWNSEPDTCERLVDNPKAILQQEGIFPEVELVLKRHDIANEILNLEEEIQAIEKTESKSLNVKNNEASFSGEEKPGKKTKNPIVKRKIAKAKQNIRNKNEIVSFQCFMQENASGDKNVESVLSFNDTNFVVRTRYFPIVEGKGESQITMYNEFAKVLDSRFHYSKLTSRSDINAELKSSDLPDNNRLLQEPTYLLSRLEVLNNVDIFLGNNWVLEREDLLKVYPYHVHLQNYVNSFRAIYDQNRGRL
jgi:hypothetical protein